jgi:hypothetical protein
MVAVYDIKAAILCCINLIGVLSILWNHLLRWELCHGRRRVMVSNFCNEFSLSKPTILLQYTLYKTLYSPNPDHFLLRDIGEIVIQHR